MLMTKRKPASVGELLIEEFMKPMGLTQGALDEAMGVQRKHVDELCNDRRDGGGQPDHAHFSITSHPSIPNASCACNRHWLVRTKPPPLGAASNLSGCKGFF